MRHILRGTLGMNVLNPVTSTMVMEGSNVLTFLSDESIFWKIFVKLYSQQKHLVHTPLRYIVQNHIIDYRAWFYKKL